MSQGNSEMEVVGAAEVAHTDPDFIVYLLDPEQDYNCYFVVGNPSLANTERIGVVKKMLMAHSPVLRAELKDSKIAEKNDVKVKDLFPETFKNLLRFVYGYDNIVSLSFDEADDLLYAAERYMMPKLKNKLAAHLIPMVNYNNICSLMNNPACYKDLELNCTITEILQVETDKVLASPQFLNLNPDGFLKILEQEVSNVAEVEVWMAAVKWAKNRVFSGHLQQLAQRPIQTQRVTKRKASKRHRKRAPSSPSLKQLTQHRHGESEDGQDAQTLRNELTEHLKHIRVCSMTDEEFLREVLPTKILSYDEAILVAESRRSGEVQPNLTMVCNVIKERDRPLVKSELLELKLPNSGQSHYGKSESSFEVKTGDTDIELCSVGLDYSHTSTSHQCNFTISVDNGKESQATVNFAGQINPTTRTIPAVINGMNLTLLRNSSYMFKFSFTCQYACVKSTSNQRVQGNHFSINHKARDNYYGSGYYICHIDKICYKTITKRVVGVQNKK